MRILAGLMVVVAFSPGAAMAQDQGTVGGQLTLTQALEIARRESPAYRQFLNNEDPAAARVRASYGSLFPTISSSAGIGYSRAGSQTLANQVFRQGSSTISSDYSISANLSISYDNFLGPSQSKAQQRATDESIRAAGVNLTADVTNQYLTALRAAATVDVAEQQVIRNKEFLDQAQARFEVGQGNMLDVRQAEVAHTRAQVQLLRSEQQETESKIELLRRMGVPAGAGVSELQLTEQFPLTEPDFDLAGLQRLAMEQNPNLRAADAQADAAHIGVKIARAAYLPSFSISTGLRGFTQQSTSVDPLLANALSSAQSQVQNCAFQNAILERLTSPHPAPGGGIIPDCNAYAGLDASGAALQPEVAQAIRDQNSGWPFGFTRAPWGISFGVSLPIWDGFSRSARVSEARASADDAREALRAQRLDIDGQVQARLLGVRTAFEAARIQDQNRAAAAQQLQLAQERWRIGSGTGLELADAQNAVTQAEVDYVTAVYDYHLAVVGLEAAVGRPLR